MPSDDSPDQGYTSMQQQAGLLPAIMAVPPPIVFPGQISAMLASGGPGAAMSILPMQNPMAAVGGFGAMGGYPSPSPMGFPSLGPSNPYSGFAGGPTSVFSPTPSAPPPMYAGPQMTPGFFGGMPAPSQFNTPYGASVQQRSAEEQQSFSNYAGYAGIGARVGAGVMAGVAGAAVGGRYGGGVGATIGGIGAMFGAEHFGVGQFAQNTFMEQIMAPRIQQRAFAAGIEHQSQNFMPFGSGAMGVGLSGDDSLRAASRLTDMGNSASFRRETFNKFNASDMASITQGAGASGMLSGVRDVEQMTGRVREVAKSLSAFMELAQEPDIQRALQSMGNLRSSGLNLSETLGAVQSGRSFARLAGMSFQEMAEVGGGSGGAMFQNMGMSAGAGFRAGTANLGLAMASQNTGILSPAMMSMLRGPQGLAAMNNQFSANMMNMPMLAPAMMTSAGGLNANSLHSLISGGQNLFGMTGSGANNLASMTGRSGVEGLGMAVAMQPMLRDQISRIVAQQGPFAQRNMEDQQIMGLARGMNMRGSAGFITAAQAAGMSETQAVARAQEMASPTFYAIQRRQAETQRLEARAQRVREREEDAPGIFDVLRHDRNIGEYMERADRNTARMRQRVSHFFGGDFENQEYVATTDEARRRMGRITGSRGFSDYMTSRTRSSRSAEEEELSIGERIRQSYALAEGGGTRGLGAAVGAFRGATELSSHDIRSAARDFRIGGELSQTLLSGGLRAEMRAATTTGQTFGNTPQGTAALGEFAQRVANMGGNAGTGSMLLNAGVRGATSLVGPGIVDPGNFLGGQGRRASQIREAFIASMRQTGVSEAEAGRTFDRNPNQIMSQAAPLARLMMGRVETDSANTAVEVGHSLHHTGGHTLTNLTEDRNQAYTALLGSAGGATGEGSARGAFNALMDNAHGVGREGTAKYEKSRRMIAAMSLAYTNMNSGDARTKERAQRLIRQMQQQASAEGLGGQFPMMARQAESLARTNLNSAGGRDAARGFMENGVEATGARTLDRFGRFDTQRTQAQAGLNMAQGYSRLSGMGGVLGGALRGVTAENFDQEAVSGKLMDIANSPDQLRALRGEGAAGRRIADELAKARDGDGEALGRVHQMMGEFGEESSAARTRHRGEFGTRAANFVREHAGAVMGGVAGLMGGFVGVAAGGAVGEFIGRRSGLNAAGRTANERAENRAMAEEFAIGSEGERNAAEQGLGATAASAAARAMGIGTSGDALLEASTQLREVATLFRETIGPGNLGRLINPEN